MKHDFEVHNGKKYPILWRKKGSRTTDKCMYCGKEHRHGTGEGHRASHCSDTRRISKKDRHYILSDGTSVNSWNDGYIIREYAGKEPVK